MFKKELTSLSLYEASEKLQNGEVTSRDLTLACLDRIDRYDNEVGAFLLIDKEKALADADAADSRLRASKGLSKIDGIPLALKDMISTKGIATTAASKILQNYIPPYDATVTKKLKDAGAVLLGKLNLDEFAMGSSNESSAYKVTKNPWDLERSPGGSSGGSAAAVAAGFAFGTLGTDTGGSIRQPAAFCGVVGIKPTYGRVSRYGVVAFASSLDQVGPFAKDVKSAALLLETIAGFDENDSTSVNKIVPEYSQIISGDVKGLKIGVPKEYFVDGLDAEIKDSVQNSIDTLVSLGAEVKPISLPSTSYAVATYYVIAAAEASSNLSRYDGVRYGDRLGEKDGLLSMYETTRGELFGAEVKRRIMLGTYVLSSGYYDAYYLRAQKVRRLFADDFAKAFAEVDLIICPTTPTPAFLIGEKISDPLKMYLNDIFTISANLAGLPALSLMSGLSKTNLPLGTQIIGKPFDETVLLNAAFALEKALKIPNNSPL
ncbi:MAG: Asp-tRNA(Asn)/Glu-tRNA(Gln) amidotransferase subunit GatA [bacterium]|nr:Asp-tRNA(Asn)/Glu-tRNA(Gln) amidotransferase subunit GatA [bacterium]